MPTMDVQERAIMRLPRLPQLAELSCAGQQLRPLRVGTRETYLPQFVILDQLRSVPVDEGIEGQPVLPAVREGKGYKVGPHCPGSLPIRRRQ